jgi:hypothetical protein
MEAGTYYAQEPGRGVAMSRRSCVAGAAIVELDRLQGDSGQLLTGTLLDYADPRRHAAGGSMSISALSSARKPTRRQRRGRHRHLDSTVMNAISTLSSRSESPTC